MPGFFKVGERFMGDERTSESAQMASLFRQHRHDVLNELQLVRGYVQLGYLDKAMNVMDRAAVWLQSLTKWQQVFENGHENVLFSAAVCPNILLADFQAITAPTDLMALELIEWLQMTQETLAILGEHVGVRMVVDGAVCQIQLPNVADDVFVQAFQRWNQFSTLVVINKAYAVDGPMKQIKRRR